MPKSIHERVRTRIAKMARDDKRAADAISERRYQAEVKADLEYEAGVQAAQTEGVLPPNASKEMRRGFDAAMRAEFE